GSNGLVYTFDNEYELGSISMLATEGMDFTYIKVKYWNDDNPNGTIIHNASVKRVQDKEGRYYHLITLPSAITANKVQICLSRYLAQPQYQLITISEVYFYGYDHLREEIMALYVDDLHMVLRDDVTQQTIDDLRERIHAPDEFGETNPNAASLEKELAAAEKILKAEHLSRVIDIHPQLSDQNVPSYGFSGLNYWQPLGVTVPLGETVAIYVGHPTLATGTRSKLRLVATQYHSESNSVITTGYNLSVGVNEFTMPEGTKANVENGGALYIIYQGTNANDRYSVRVDGGTEVPVLDLYKVTDEEERMAKTVDYIEQLDEYVPEMKSLHNQIHRCSDNKNVDYAYDPKNCILGASDILLDNMLLSLPAQQILAGAGTGTVEERAKTMLQSMDAMDEMMNLFYQHKGLNNSAKDKVNQLPVGHLNIRYQRMFSGAFMYASGNHIGIEWGSTSSLMRGVPIVSDEDGRYVSGNYFGWGIAHEIGHNINQSTYTVAEITNNYFAQLAQAKDTNTGMRFQYQNIYNKVASGTKGNCSNIATQLGMYWQLHLAYDKGLNYKTYPNYTEQLENLFYARVDTYARTPASAPSPGGVALVLGNTDQSLMRLACAASEKNVLEFFERWGKTPDSVTIAYAEQFEKETRAIFYANDDSRVYALNGEGSVLGTDCSVNAIEDVSVNIGAAANKVELGFTSADIPESDILGYEIIRCTIEGGEVDEIPVGFSTSSSFTDTVTTLNNRAVFYKVTLIDQYLNRSATFTTKMVKIEHDGSIDKTNWTVSTSNLSAATVSISDEEGMSACQSTTNNPADQVIDNDLNTVYTPKITNVKAEIVIDFHKNLTATGLKYTAGEGTPAGAYEVYVRTNGEWKLTANGTFKGSETVYFANDDNQYISTYSADAVKLVLLNQRNKTVSIAELDVLAPTGDNVDFRRAGEEKMTVIGTLSADYQYGDQPEDVIPEDSLVFTGSYKGNPAYNVVMLFDGDGNIVGGTDGENLLAQQIILADVPENSNIANVSDGTWIYWIEPDQMDGMTMPETVRVELYRVNNALTNEGQRLVSDSLFEEVPDNLPEITFEK
ncbi:MAG: M60 family metallopeptidase, partial [Ruminococcus flavefaciens]|nr:M60 family metallopeptidase [Ruminococcus flavefaciens]